MFSSVHRHFSFLSRITEAFSMAYITRKKPVMCNDCCSAVQWQSMGPSNGRYMYALIVRSIHIEQISNVRSDKY